MARALAAPLALAARPLDRARLWWLRALGPIGRVLVRDRDARVAVLGTVAIGVALVLVLWVPLWVLALGPIVWGVPHVASDVRYLVVRPGLHRRALVWALVFVPLAILTFESDGRWGFVAMIGAALVARTSWPRRLALACVALAVLGLSIADRWTVALVFAHAHNYVALGFFAGWRRDRRSWWFALPIGIVVVASAAIALGAADSLFASTLEGEAGGAGLGYHLRALAPGFEAPWGERMVLLFALAQSAHYVVWLRLVPDEDRLRPTPRSFHATLVAMREDGSLWPVLVLLALSLGLACWAVVDLFAAREGYLRAVLGHGHLELAVLALLVAEGRSLRSIAAPERV